MEQAPCRRVGVQGVTSLRPLPSFSPGKALAPELSQPKKIQVASTQGQGGTGAKISLMMMGASPGLWTERNLRAAKLVGEGLPPGSKPGSLRVEQHVFPRNPEETAEPTSDSAFLFSDSSRASGGDAMCREPHHWGTGGGSLSKSWNPRHQRKSWVLMRKPVAWGDRIGPIQRALAPATKPSDKLLLRGGTLSQGSKADSNRGATSRLALASCIWTYGDGHLCTRVCTQTHPHTHNF